MHISDAPQPMPSLGLEHNLGGRPGAGTSEFYPVFWVANQKIVDRHICISDTCNPDLAWVWSIQRGGVNYVLGMYLFFLVLTCGFRVN